MPKRSPMILKIRKGTPSRYRHPLILAPKPLEKGKNLDLEDAQPSSTPPEVVRTVVLLSVSNNMCAVERDKYVSSQMMIKQNNFSI